MDSKKYTYLVTWSAEDNEYVGLCAEFPLLSWLDIEQSKAFSGIVDKFVTDMISKNEKLPVPLSEKKIIADGLLFMFHQWVMCEQKMPVCPGYQLTWMT